MGCRRPRARLGVPAGGGGPQRGPGLGFTGYAVSWVAARGPARGAADVYVDGELVRRVDLHATTREARSIAFAKHWAANGKHTIEIVNVGTAGHPRIDVDAFIRLVAT